MKMYEVLNFQKIYDVIKDNKMPLKTVYKMTKIAMRVEEESAFYQEKFGGIIREYGQTDEEGNYIFTDDKTSIKIIEGKEQDCREKMKELTELEVDMNYKFTLDELEGLDLTIEQMSMLLPFVEE